jgi:hypothetical protein
MVFVEIFSAFFLFLSTNVSFISIFSRFLDYKDTKNSSKSHENPPIAFIIFVILRHKSKFAATLLPPKKCLNTDVLEDWWQSGSKNIIFFRFKHFGHKPLVQIKVLLRVVDEKLVGK